MSLEEWKNNGWLKEHRTSPQEIANLFAIVRRDLEDAKAQQVSADWRFGIAYNAALKLCTILLVSEGYRPDKNLAHYRTLQALPLILNSNKKADAAYLDTCRVKRNIVEYDMAGAATTADADELIHFANALLKEVESWLTRQHPDLKV
ncbi:MAG TPA: hypothetical protein PKM57_04370 [Kiritimatiellia bacterium]|mgnify:CR=1 FL=1|nr:hypothetical protein [Kiritimatiellia bacterium]HPS06082.1 hypothetical protein [Kiritimatiellia bacterium]